MLNLSRFVWSPCSDIIKNGSIVSYTEPDPMILGYTGPDPMILSYTGPDPLILGYTGPDPMILDYTGLLYGKMGATVGRGRSFYKVKLHRLRVHGQAE